MSLVDRIRPLIPARLMDMIRRLKRRNRRRNLERQAQKGEGSTMLSLREQLTGMGIRPGDHLLFHSSLSKLGHVEGGPATVIRALEEAVGPEGTVLMPTSPNARLQADYAREHPVFDVVTDPSTLGAVTETFRKMPGTQRSWSPTEPVCARGRQASWFVRDHHLDPTPYGPHSPFYRLAEANGKILYAGVTLINAGTSLHLLEDAVDFPYPVYLPDPATFTVVTPEGERLAVATRIHNPDMSRRRRCDELIPLFESEGVLQKVRFGRANCLLLDARGMLEIMIRAFREQGVTMYTPKGEPLQP